jgi:hypothetical protein
LGHRLLRISSLTVLATSLLVAAWLVVNRARGFEAFAAGRIAEQASAAGAKVRQQLGHLLTQLGAVRALGVLGVFGPMAEDRYVEAVAALMVPVAQAAAVIAATPERRFLLSGSPVDGAPVLRPLALDPDQGEPPWQRELPQAAADGQIRWLDEDSGLPAGLGTLGAWIAWESPPASGSYHWVAVAIGDEQIKELAGTLTTSEWGEVFLISDLKRVLHISPKIPGYEEVATWAELVDALGGAGVLPLAEAVRTLAPDSHSPAPGRIQLGGRPAWYALQPLRLGERVFWLGLVVPESDLLPPLRRAESRLLFVLLGVLTAAVASVFLLAGLYGRRLEQLAETPRYRSATEEELLRLIEQGEHERLEFKSTMRWNLKEDRPGAEISRAWLKTLAAFLNSEGGTLLIGVADDRRIVGIEADRFGSEDKALLHFNNLIKEHVGLEHAGPISAALRPVGGKTILVVDCEPSSSPVFLKFGDEEEYFVRLASGSRKLPVSKVLEHIKGRHAR